MYWETKFAFAPTVNTPLLPLPGATAVLVVAEPQVVALAGESTSVPLVSVRFPPVEPPPVSVCVAAFDPRVPRLKVSAPPVLVNEPAYVELVGAIDCEISRAKRNRAAGRAATG